MLKFHAIQCRKCKDIVYSVCRHDWRNCSCGHVYIDGDSQVTGSISRFRIGSQNLAERDLVSTIIEVDATKEELYADWNQLEYPRKYGLIKGTKND